MSLQGLTAVGMLCSIGMSSGSGHKSVPSPVAARVDSYWYAMFLPSIVMSSGSGHKNVQVL